MPMAPSIPTMIMTTIISIRVKDLIEDFGVGVKPLFIYLFFLFRAAAVELKLIDIS